MEKINSKQYWDKRFESGDWNDKGGAEQSTYFANIALNALPEWFKEELSRNKYTIHDWGCGQGEGTSFMAKHFPSCLFTGYDFSFSAIKTAKEKNQNCQYEVGDIYKDIKNADVIMSSNTLEHLKNSDEIMKEIISKSDKHTLLILPLNDKTGIDEHINIFSENTFPLRINNKYLSFFKIVDCSKDEIKYWPGQQIVLIYSDEKQYPLERERLSDLFNNSEYLKLDELCLELKANLDKTEQELIVKGSRLMELDASWNERYNGLLEANRQQNETFTKIAEELEQEKNTSQAQRLEIEKIKNEATNLKCKNILNEAKIDKLSEEKKIAEIKIDELTKKNNKTKEELETLSSDLNKLKQENKALQTQDENLNNEKKRNELWMQRTIEQHNSDVERITAINSFNAKSNEEAKTFLLNLSNTGIYRLAHYLTRFVQQFLRGTWEDKKQFVKWLFGDKEQKNHKYNPLYTAMDLIKYQTSDVTPLPLQAEEIKSVNKYDLIDPEEILEEKYKNMDIIVLSIIDYDFRYQRPQHIAKRFADKGHRVFFVNANFKELYAEKKITENLKSIYLSPEGNIYSDTWIKDIANIEKQIDKLIDKNKIADALIIVDYPNWYEAAKYTKEKYGFKVVMDYMDDFAGFINPVADLVRDNCIKVLEISDKVIASSNFLADCAKKYNSNIEIIRNATEYEYFHEASTTKSEKQRKIIGYYGAISTWFNTEVVCKCAERFPDCDIVLIGEVTAEDRRFEKYSNVKLLGEKKYDELVDFLKDFDVCLIPFDTTTDLIKATNPVKFYEYLSAGKKIVATEIPELEPYKNKYCYLENEPEKFCDKVALCLNGTDELESKEKMYSFASQNDWDHRAEQFFSSVESLYKKVSIVVLSYNNLEYTQKCIKSVLDNTAYPNYEIIIVDNDSKDKKVFNWLTNLKLRESNIKVKFNKENRGFAGGNNDGIEMADGEYIVLLNNDTEITRGWLTRMINHFEKNKDLGLVGPVTNSIGNESKINTDYSDSKEMRKFAWDYTIKNMAKEYKEVNVLAMFCLMIKKEVYKKIGKLDENFGTGMFEDDDYSYSVKKAGYEITIAEDSFVHHYGSESFKKINDEKRQKLFDDNKAYFEKKWNTKWIPHKYREGVK